MASLTLIWLQFAVCAVLIGLAGFQLSRYGDVIAHRTGLSGGWIGMALLATATSLPELVTGITSVTVADAPNLALGNALGSCNRASQGHVLAAGFGVVMLGFVMVSLLVSHLSYPGQSPTPAFLANLGFSLATPVVFLLYMVAMRTVFSYERAHATPAPLVPDDTRPDLRQAVQRFVLAAAVVFLAGLWLPFVALDLAIAMGWNRSFVGSMFVALVTTLPELAVTLSALRIGAVDMAIGNLLGSNLFNVAIVAVDDLFYRQGSLLADSSPVHAVTAGSAIIMTGLAMIGLFFRPRSRVLRAVGWVSLGLLAVYLFNTYVLYLHGD
jgi:cation:H+ antiporter